MSGADPQLLINANIGNLAKLFTSEQSLWDNKGYQSTNIFAVDNTFSAKPVGTQANFAGQDRFRLRKRGGRVHRTWLRTQISAGVVAGANQAAYVDDLGQLMLAGVRAEYASKNLHEYRGEMLKAYFRLMFHDISREAYNAMQFAGLPPGPGGSEAVRQANVSAATTVYVNLSWLWWTRFEDYALTPEGLASELDLVVTYAPLEQLVYARVVATGLTPAADPFTTRPAITLSELFTQLIHVPGPEKSIQLASFEHRQGQLFKILDAEEQLKMPMPAAAGVYSFKLDNFRLDSQFIMFYVRTTDIDTAWKVDRMQSDPTPSILPAALVTPVNALQAITSFRLIANGKPIVDPVTDIENRAHHRDIYFPGSQIAEPIYFIPFSWLLRDAKNVTGFQNLANLGNLELELTVPVSATTRYVDAYNICHNIIQQKKGDIIKALR